MSRIPHIDARLQDRLARGIITSGGVLLILTVAAILVFILREAAPLAGGAHVSENSPVPVPEAAPVLACGVDENRTLAFAVGPHEIVYQGLADSTQVQRFPTAFADAAVTTATYDPHTALLVSGSADGQVALQRAGFRVRWQGSTRTTLPDLETLGVLRLADSLGVDEADAERDEDGAYAVVARLQDGSLHYVYVDEEGEELAREDLTADLDGRSATSATVSLHGAMIAAGTADGTLLFWNLDDPEAPELEDHMSASEAPLRDLALLLGDQSLVVGAGDGVASIWFRVRYIKVVNEADQPREFEGAELEPGATRVVLDRDYGKRYGHVEGLRFFTAGRPWTRIRDFRAGGDAIEAIAVSPRDKGFATFDAAGRLALHYSTSHRTLGVFDTGMDDLHALVFAPRANGLVGLDAAGRLHRWGVDNPHPEAGLQALFGKVWYEGYSQPKFVWQSTGGSAEFEPKLSLVPLFVGTLKGTLYAMLFSIPISVLGALYLSQLATPGLRNLVKPVAELMAGIPSVVVGFLAALWLAPVLEENLGEVLGAALFLPLGLVGALGTWLLLPRGVRQAAPAGSELLFMLPFLGLALWLGTLLASPLEAAFFGGDLRSWLYEARGIHYDQRNCIVVGVALGFAVIPIILTICEDAMSSVPSSLTSAALALGASRWQTAFHVILPAASPGIFAAVMLGLGRAIGETMIVLMATGNTPILDLSPFNGMRTMSAAIAVEIPEAPHGGTLYRVLFLTGTLLFAITFLINTAADLVSRRLRKRYAQF